MVSRKAALGFALLFVANLAHAQSTSGTIAGRVTDPQGAVANGVIVTVESPNLQGVRTAITSATGDYILTNLPSGPYTVSFELEGFQRLQQSVNLAPTQVLPVDAKLRLGKAAVAVTVTGSTNLLMQTTQVATNLRQDVIKELPTTRDINAAVLMAPSVHATGPA